MQKINPNAVQDQVVSSAAYNLFYRLRDPSASMDTMDYDTLRQAPDMDFLNSLSK